jgi:hypothetical protein
MVLPVASRVLLSCDRWEQGLKRVGGKLTVNSLILLFSSRLSCTSPFRDFSLWCAICAFSYSSRSDSYTRLTCCIVKLQHISALHTNFAVPFTRLCKILAFPKFTWISCICSSNSSTVRRHVQFSQSGPRQWERHRLCSWSMVLDRDSKIITRSRILSSIILSLCRSTKFTTRSGNGERASVSLWTLASVTLSDCWQSRQPHHQFRSKPTDLTFQKVFQSS